MLTPQDIQEIAFEKAVFGGYDMQSVDEYLEPLTEDYITLYKENAVLKSKMRLLVEKLEEYRGKEESMKSAIVTTQKTCDEMIANAEKQCNALLADAENSAKDKSQDVDTAVNAEIERLNCAKAATEEFILIAEAELHRWLEMLENLKKLDLEPEKIAHIRTEKQHKAYDYESEKDEEPKREDADELVTAIGANVEKLMGDDQPKTDNDATRVFQTIAPERKQDKFDNLQFGKNYDPMG